MRNVLIFLFFGLILGSSSALAEESAQSIIDKAMDRNAMGFQSGLATLDLQIQDAKGVKLERSLEVRSRKISERAHTLVKLTAPREVFGQSFLFVENEKEDDVWMYLPAFKVTRRVEGGQKNGSFLGSHFTYADFESRDIKEATHKHQKDEEIGKVPVYVIESTPKQKNSEYAKVVVYVRKSDYVPLRVRFFDRSNQPVKTLFIRKLDKTEKGQTYAKEMTLQASAGGHTTITIQSLSETELPETLFSRDQLGK